MSLNLPQNEALQR